MIRLFNSLTKTVEVFTPISKTTVTMYNCGPTVYNFVHIGNLRSYVFADTLRRVLENAHYAVTQVINITDIGHLTSDGDSGEDKMMKGLVREGLPINMDGMKKLADIYTDAFLNDINLLNIPRPEVLPRASEHIADQIKIISILEKKGFIYTTSDGVYFDTKKFPEYGILGGTQKKEESLARIEGNSEKRDPRDFALWKFNENLGWESPWGKGFPGWHIECSAMSMKYLGETFDIHTGGVDHISVHHNNEIAQSECATGKPLAHYWLHNEFVTIEGGKMAKSEGNFITLRSLIERGIHPLAYRYLLLSAHYRSPLHFTWDALNSAHTALEKLVHGYILSSAEETSLSTDYKAFLTEALEDDLNTPRALALLHKLQDEPLSKEIRRPLIALFDATLGLSIEALAEQVQKIPPEVLEKHAERMGARKEKDWTKSDTIRQELHDEGYILYDEGDTTTVLSSLKRLLS